MFAVTNIQLFRERLWGKVHATILESIVGGFEVSFFQRNLKELSRKAMEVCLRVLKESNKSRLDSYSHQEQCIDHIPYYLSGLSRAHFFPTTFLEIAVYSSLRAHHPITPSPGSTLPALLTCFVMRGIDLHLRIRDIRGNVLGKRMRNYFVCMRNFPRTAVLKKNTYQS